eukprot:g1070.t1
MPRVTTPTMHKGNSSPESMEPVWKQKLKLLRRKRKQPNRQKRTPTEVIQQQEEQTAENEIYSSTKNRSPNDSLSLNAKSPDSDVPNIFTPSPMNVGTAKNTSSVKMSKLGTAGSPTKAETIRRKLPNNPFNASAYKTPPRPRLERNKGRDTLSSKRQPTENEVLSQEKHDITPIFTPGLPHNMDSDLAGDLIDLGRGSSVVQLFQGNEEGEIQENHAKDIEPVNEIEDRKESPLPQTRLQRVDTEMIHEALENDLVLHDGSEDEEEVDDIDGNPATEKISQVDEDKEDTERDQVGELKLETTESVRFDVKKISLQPRSLQTRQQWKMAQSSEGKIYYYNRETRESQWEKPTGPGVVILQSPYLQSPIVSARKDPKDVEIKQLKDMIEMLTLQLGTAQAKIISLEQQNKILEERINSNDIIESFKMDDKDSMIDNANYLEEEEQDNYQEIEKSSNQVVEKHIQEVNADMSMNGLNPVYEQGLTQYNEQDDNQEPHVKGNESLDGPKIDTSMTTTMEEETAQQNKSFVDTKPSTSIPEEAEIAEDATDENTLVPCPECGRTFLKHRLEVHARVCRRIFQEKRIPFDSMQRRLKDTPNRTVVCAGAHRCPICSTSFVNDDALSAHMTVCRQTRLSTSVKRRRARNDYFSPMAALKGSQQQLGDKMDKAAMDSLEDIRTPPPAQQDDSQVVRHSKSAPPNNSKSATFHELRTSDILGEGSKTEEKKPRTRVRSPSKKMKKCPFCKVEVHAKKLSAHLLKCKQQKKSRELTTNKEKLNSSKQKAFGVNNMISPVCADGRKPCQHCGRRFAVKGGSFQRHVAVCAQRRDVVPLRFG